MLFYQDILSELSVVHSNEPHGNTSYILVDELVLNHSVELTRTISNVHVTQAITLASRAQRCIIASAQNSLSLTQEGREVKWEEVDSVLSLVSLGTGFLTNPVSNDFVVAHTVSISVLYNRTSSLVLTSLVTCQLISKAYKVQTGPPYVPPHNSRIQLTYSPVGYGSIILTLRNPIFTDTDTVEYRRINRRSRGNTLQIFRDAIWPVANRLNYTFNDLSDSEKSDLLSFMETSIGKQITLVDYEQRNWLGIIITPSADIKQTFEQNNSVNLQFEGTLV